MSPIELTDKVQALVHLLDTLTMLACGLLVAGVLLLVRAIWGWSRAR